MGLFFNHFWSFLPAGDFFSRNLALSHTIIYGLLTPYYVSEKPNEPIPRKIMDRWKDGRTEGRMDRRTDGQKDLFHRSLHEMAGGRKNKC